MVLQGLKEVSIQLTEGKPPFQSEGFGSVLAISESGRSSHISNVVGPH